MEHPREDLLPLSPAIGRLMALEQLAARRGRPKRKTKAASGDSAPGAETHLANRQDRRPGKMSAHPVSQDT
jgi:hypothetical protein